MKHLIGLLLVSVPAFVMSGATAQAATLAAHTFAYDEQGVVLEYYPATAAKATVQGRAFMQIGVREKASNDLLLLLDCQARRLAVVGVSVPAPSAEGPRVAVDGIGGQFMAPEKGMYERFVAATCDGELPEVETSAARSGWKHFIEGPERALYFTPVSTSRLGKYRAASVRLYELGGAQLPDGRHIDARDAVWVIDCEQGLGAVAYERAFARVDGRNETVVTSGDENLARDPSAVDPTRLRFGRPLAGSSQEQFGQATCAGSLGSGPAK
jgi:hypothetical protein